LLSLKKYGQTRLFRYTIQVQKNLYEAILDLVCSDRPELLYNEEVDSIPFRFVLIS